MGQQWKRRGAEIPDIFRSWVTKLGSVGIGSKLERKPMDANKGTPTRPQTSALSFRIGKRTEPLVW